MYFFTLHTLGLVIIIIIMVLLVFSLLSSSVPISVGMECPASAMECNREGCVDLRDVCDLTDNCGDRTDEDSCGEKSDVF